MSAHVVLFGPSTAGKTSLMLGLSRLEHDYSFTVDRTWTTRARRPHEGNEENVFVSSDEFEARRNDFMFTFRTHPTYEYGIDTPSDLRDKEIRMRILMPVFALRFRQLVRASTIFCSIAPHHSDPERVFRDRDPHADDADLQQRLDRFRQDSQEADLHADIRFQNCEGLDVAVQGLASAIINRIQT